MHDASSDALQPNYRRLLKALLVVGGLYYVVFAGFGFNTDTELRQFLEEAATRPATDAEQTDQVAN